MYSYYREDEFELYKVMMPDGAFLCWVTTKREAEAVCAELNKGK